MFMCFAMNVLARLMMKNVAKCNIHCELQNSVNQKVFERHGHPWDMPEGTLDSMSSSLLCFCLADQVLLYVCAHTRPWAYVYQSASQP